MISIDEKKAEAILKLFKDLGEGSTSTPPPPTEEPEEEPGFWSWESIKKNPWAYIATWNFTDPIWWAIMLPTGVGAATAAQTGWALKKSMTAAELGLPRSSTFGRIARTPAGNITWSRGLTARELNIARESPRFMSQLEQYTANRAARGGVRPALTEAEVQFLRTASSRTGSNLMQRVTAMNLPQRAITELSEQEIIAAEISPTYRAELQLYYNAGGKKPTMPSTQTLEELVSANAKPPAAAKPGPRGPSGTGASGYGRYGNEGIANPPGTTLARIVGLPTEGVPFGTRLAGSGVGGTGLTQQELTTSGLRALGQYSGEVGSNVPLSQMGMGRTASLATRQGLGQAAGEAAVGTLPLLAYEIPVQALTHLSKKENLYAGLSGGSQPHYSYSFDPVGYTIGNAPREWGNTWKQAYDPNAGFAQNVGNVLAATPQAAFNTLTSYFRQTVPQNVRGPWSSETNRAFGSSYLKAPGYTPGGALAYAWGSTPQSSGLSPGAWLLQQRTGKTSGWIGG